MGSPDRWAPHRRARLRCLTGCDLVLVPAGMPRKPGMTRDDLFKARRWGASLVLARAGGRERFARTGGEC